MVGAGPETATSGLLRVQTSHQGNRVYFENAITQYDLEALPEAFTSSDALPVAPSWEALEENEANYVLNLGERSIDGFSRVDVGFEYEGPANTRARLRAFVYSDADPENQRLIENCNYMEAGANELSECWVLSDRRDLRFASEGSARAAGLVGRSAGRKPPGASWLFGKIVPAAKLERALTIYRCLPGRSSRCPRRSLKRRFPMWRGRP